MQQIQSYQQREAKSKNQPTTRGTITGKLYFGYNVLYEHQQQLWSNIKTSNNLCQPRFVQTNIYWL